MEELEIINRMSQNSRWLESSYEKIKKRYADQFIAVKDSNIVGSDKDYKKLLKKLEAKGIDPKLVYIEYIPLEGLMLIL